MAPLTDQYAAMDLVVAPDHIHGQLRLLRKPLDVTLTRGQWSGPGADELQRALQHGEECGGHVLSWPKRIRSLKISGARVELGDIGKSPVAAHLREYLDAAWPAGERQTSIPSVYPFWLRDAQEGARITGELLVEIQ